MTGAPEGPEGHHKGLGVCSLKQVKSLEDGLLDQGWTLQGEWKSLEGPIWSLRPSMSTWKTALSHPWLLGVNFSFHQRPSPLREDLRFLSREFRASGASTWA